MQRQDFHYHLPKHLIASQPSAERSGSRLLVLGGQSSELEHQHFVDLPGYLDAGDLLVFNDTRVIPARLWGHKASGGRVEILIERIVDGQTALAQVRASKAPKSGSELILDSGKALTVAARRDQFLLLDFHEPVLELLTAEGEIPLPPYMERPPTAFDSERYQTVYAREPGAVAAPTAGLHFDQALLQTLSDKGVGSAFLTLHVGAGTFQPVRVDNLDRHQMHGEWMDLGAEACEKIRLTRQAGKRVIAVGTTSVRALESAASEGEVRPFSGETQIFIRPPYQFQVVDALITNFHLPESTLLMLVSAFAGFDRTMAVYQAAVADHYRFFSYGDAMFITRRAGGSDDR